MKGQREYVCYLFDRFATTPWGVFWRYESVPNVRYWIQSHRTKASAQKQVRRLRKKATRSIYERFAQGSGQ